jgi:hypothetical protein
VELLVSILDQMKLVIGKEPKLIGKVDVISFNSIHFRYVNSMLAQMRFQTEPPRGPLRPTFLVKKDTSKIYMHVNLVSEI